MRGFYGGGLGDTHVQSCRKAVGWLLGRGKNVCFEEVAMKGGRLGARFAVRKVIILLIFRGKCLYLHNTPY